ncbi:hypothetical protein Tco_0820344 [Tanacetum coccineum]|uniref:Uncharacterized protein n=1 Tax=Tanacetum coccineum TaxID=301880 RepID=A0ABQ5A961_9ASTR
MDTAYGRRWIHRIGNCEYAFTCEDLALIRRISFPGYGVLIIVVREQGYQIWTSIEVFGKSQIELFFVYKDPIFESLDMSTSNTHQQSLTDAGFETRPPMLERGEALVSVYNRFAQLMNDLERNGIKFPPVTVNTKFLNYLQPEWLKYVTQVRLAKRLTEDSYDDLFDYLQQFEKLVNASRAKKLEKSHDPLALVAHTGCSSRTTSPYYVTHPSLVVDYDEDYQGDAVQNTSISSIKDISNLLVGLMVPLVKPLDIRKFESLSYQALGACFNLYRAFLRL